MDETNDGGEVSDEEAVVLEALGVGFTFAEAAALVGREAKWVSRRMRDIEFRREARRRRTAHLDSLAAQVTLLGPRAVSVLRESMDDPDRRMALKAAVSALGMVTRITAKADLDARLAELEMRVLQDELGEGSAR